MEQVRRLKQIDARRERTPTALPEETRLHWRLYYADGRMLGSHQATWEEAPRTNIVAVVQAINDEPPEVQLGTPYYWHLGDWIARIWEPGLYLRQTGKVKFGRWTSHEIFQGAWKHALQTISGQGKDMSEDPTIMQSGSTCRSSSAQPNESGFGWCAWYDDKKLYTSELAKWEDLPSDGLLCVVYGRVLSHIKTEYAIRRYTYYFWNDLELVNTDDLDEVLERFPACKWGQPSFAGKSYLNQGEAIAAAFRDTLEDVRK